MWLPSNEHHLEIRHGSIEGDKLLLTDTVKVKMIKSSNIKLAELGIVVLL